MVTSAPTAEVVIPPWLRQVSPLKNNLCNSSPGFSRVVMQAGQRGGIVDFSSDYLVKGRACASAPTP